ncbi:hypothetical protein [Micromonospora sp. CB01531]|uniref:hypothetical protein n=1 Tax=Micromonospora sp. CB01531 TaxID=1718947 RepID=UPI00093FA098|nr:hypothetical protein [Micromonospora sp. CB01531]OKI45098.1 hypothetical protein A6A27_11810 [Micromonospora sp. CB01531]
MDVYDIRDRFDSEYLEGRRQARIARRREIQQATADLSDDEIRQAMAWLASIPGSHRTAMDALTAELATR